jgi:hypothetical protein
VHAAHVRGAEPAHAAPAGPSRHADAALDARTGRGTRHGGPGVRDRRTRREAGHGPDRPTAA